MIAILGAMSYNVSNELSFWHVHLGITTFYEWYARYFSSKVQRKARLHSGEYPEKMQLIPIVLCDCQTHEKRSIWWVLPLVWGILLLSKSRDLRRMGEMNTGIVYCCGVCIHALTLNVTRHLSQFHLQNEAYLKAV